MDIQRESWHQRARVGGLEEDFLNPRHNPTAQALQSATHPPPSGAPSSDATPTGHYDQVAADAALAQSLYAQQFYDGNGGDLGALGRLSVTVAHAKLNKNYGIVRMDPYCRLRVGKAIAETSTDYNGAKSPKWNKTLFFHLMKDVTTLFIEVFDERSFTADTRIAWAHIDIPECVLRGETIDEWYTLMSDHGGPDSKEGLINLVLSFTDTTNMVNELADQRAAAQVMSSAPPLPIPYSPGMAQMLQPVSSNLQHREAVPGEENPEEPVVNETDIKQLTDMFPRLDREVIVCVLEASGGNSEAALNNLLSMT